MAGWDEWTLQNRRSKLHCQDISSGVWQKNKCAWPTPMVKILLCLMISDATVGPILIRPHQHLKQPNGPHPFFPPLKFSFGQLGMDPVTMTMYINIHKLCLYKKSVLILHSCKQGSLASIDTSSMPTCTCNSGMNGCVGDRWSIGTLGAKTEKQHTHQKTTSRGHQPSNNPPCLCPLHWWHVLLCHQVHCLSWTAHWVMSCELPAVAIGIFCPAQVYVEST